MNGSYFSLMDMAIGGVPVILFCIWQLVSINREIAKDKAKADSTKRASPEGASSNAALPESARHPVGEHRLDNR